MTLREVRFSIRATLLAALVVGCASRTRAADNSRLPDERQLHHNVWYHNTRQEIIDVNGTASRYARGELMVYHTQFPPPFDSLRTYYFRSIPVGAYSTSAPNHWLIPASSDHADNVIFRDNQCAPNTWRDPAQTKFRIAAKLQLVDRVPDSLADSAALEVEVVKREYDFVRRACRDTSADHHPDTLRFGSCGTRFAVRLGAFQRAYTDMVFFSPESILPSPCDGNTVMQITVFSKRFVDMQTAWVALEDATAHDVLAGMILDASDPASNIFNTSMHTIPQIVAASGATTAPATSATSNNAPLSEFACRGRIISLLNNVSADTVNHVQALRESQGRKK